MASDQDTEGLVLPVDAMENDALSQERTLSERLDCSLESTIHNNLREI